MPQANTAAPPALPSSRGAALALAVLFASGLAAPAAAQSLGAGSSRFNGGWGGASSSLNQPINVATRDQNNNQVFVNGLMQTPEGSVFSNADGLSRSAAGGGVGASGLATAIGNNLNVVVQGSWNRVVVDSTQINNGDVSASVGLNGQINLDGP